MTDIPPRNGTLSNPDDLDATEGVVDVVKRGEFDKLGEARHLAGVAEGVANFIPGARVIGDTIGGVAGSYRTQLEMDELKAKQKKLGINVDAGSNKLLRKSRDQYDAKPVNFLAKFAAQAVGAAIGVAVLLPVATVVLPIPIVGAGVGMLAGGFVGGMLGGKAYEYVMEKTEQDAAKNAAKAQIKINNGGAMTAEEAFVNLVSTFPDAKPINEKLEVALERITTRTIGSGTRDFAEALKSAEGREAIRQIMQSDLGQQAGDMLRGSLGIVSNDPLQSVFEQYAQLVNSRRIEPVDLVKNPSAIAAASSEEMVDNLLAEGNAPFPNPEVGALAKRMNQMGVVPGTGQAAALPPAVAGSQVRDV